MDRRRFLEAATAATTALVGAALSTPLLGRLLSPLSLSRQSASSTEIPVGQLDTFPLSTPRRIAFPVTVEDGWERRTATRAAWVVRHDEDDLRVYSTACPHLGCSVEWSPKRDEFACPCHESGFTKNGERKHGPAPRGLDELPCRVVGGELRVQWVDFVTGTKESRPVGERLS